MRQLLFTPSSSYEGQTLFRQFDDDAQEQIKVSLGRLVNVLPEAYSILSGRYGASEGRELFESGSSESLHGGKDSWLIASSHNKPDIRRQTSTLQMIKWSFRDKKRVETIISDFARLNAGIHEYIKFICLGSTIGVGLRHLEFLQDDENSIRLGFDIDAKLKLSVHSGGEMPQSLELSSTWGSPTLELPISQRFAIFEYDRRSYLVENRPYEGVILNSSDIEPLAAHRIDALARLLQQPKEQIFRIPRCIGWRHIQRRHSIAFIYENPTPQCGQLINLNSLFRSDQERPSLGSRFSLAYGLAKGIAQLHLVKWVSSRRITLINTDFAISCTRSSAVITYSSFPVKKAM